MRRGGEAALQNIQETVQSLLGVKIDAFEGSGRRDAELDVDNFLVQVNGSGIREALRLVLDVEFEKPDVVLVEEPKMHLHPALETSMMRYLKRVSTRCQVFLTTHSTNFLDTAEMKNVYLVSQPKATEVQLLDFEEAESQIPKELGLKLSSLFMYDRLVFVEGTSDESVLREWASSLNVNLSQANVGFVVMGGARNLSYFAAESTMSFLTKRQVRLWFTVDRDEKDDEQLAKLTSTLGDKAAVKVLSRREIENYLLAPRAIAQFVQLKTRLSGEHEAEAPSESDVRAAIEAVAEDLKEFAIEKRLQQLVSCPIYPKVSASPNAVGENAESFRQALTEELQSHVDLLVGRIEGIQNAFEQATREIGERWDDEKLGLVPGDELLDGVCQKFGVRFKKERDGARLAGLLERNEIDDEIKELLLELVE